MQDYDKKIKFYSSFYNKEFNALLKNNKLVAKELPNGNYYKTNEVFKLF